MVYPIFVPGEPVLSGGRGQDEWQRKIRDCAPSTVTYPKLTFVVSSLKRYGQLFDLDNLVHPVLMVFHDPIDNMTARLYVDDQPGLLIEDAISDPPTENVLRYVYVQSHSKGSVRNRPGISEIADDAVFDEHEGVGLSLAFDSDDIPIRKGWFGPTEAVVDDLVPWLGRYTARGLIADHRIRDLRISRGNNPDGMGVSIAIWYVPNESVSIPGDVRAHIDDLNGDQPTRS
jgi:hypothetical protein